MLDAAMKRSSTCSLVKLSIFASVARVGLVRSQSVAFSNAKRVISDRGSASMYVQIVSK